MNGIGAQGCCATSDLQREQSVRDVVSTLPDFVVPQQYRQVIERIADVAAELARRIAGLEEEARDGLGRNADGDAQTPLDLIADAAFRAALTGSGVRHYVSEEQEAAARARSRGVGSRWRSIRSTGRRTSRSTSRSARSSRSIPAEETAEASFLRPGRSLVGAGYVIYGPRCFLVASFGEGVQKYQLDPASRRFRLVGRPGDAAGEVGGVRDQRLELPALGPRRSAPTSTTASRGPRGRASATSTCAGSPRWSPRRIAS